MRVSGCPPHLSNCGVTDRGIKFMDNPIIFTFIACKFYCNYAGQSTGGSLELQIQKKKTTIVTARCELVGLFMAP